MNFRLTYEGPIMHRGGGLPHKQEIRKAFHKQLKRFWEVHPMLEQWRKHSTAPSIPVEVNGQIERPRNPQSRHDYLAELYTRGNYHFIPIATEDRGAIVSLDILFLRSGIPGHATNAADLDGRLKTLIDALRIPDKSNIGDLYEKPDVDENPFYCLMEDDKLVGNISVITDTLLQPTPSSSGYFDTHDARVVIAVSIRTYLTGTYGSAVWM
jgi:hypothetical protein